MKMLSSAQSLERERGLKSFRERHTLTAQIQTLRKRRAALSE